jgi:RNA polymerase sigma factor (TIGR02999 family)
VLLDDWSNGDASAIDQLIPLVYDDLRRIALHQLGKERPDHTLQPTALINEVFLRLLRQNSLHWESRDYFFGAAAKLMRRILVDSVRRRRADKRGDPLARVDLAEANQVAGGYNFEFLALDEALDRLAAIDPKLAHIVELRFFGGLEVDEIAQLLGVSTATVKREWASAKAWLRHQLTKV